MFNVALAHVCPAHAARHCLDLLVALKYLLKYHSALDGA